MPVDDVSIYKHRVTALMVLRHTSLLTDFGKFVGCLDVNCEPIFAQVGYIALAATALRALVKDCTDRGGHDRQRQDRGHKGGALTEGPSVHVYPPSKRSLIRQRAAPSSFRKPDDR